MASTDTQKSKRDKRVSSEAQKSRSALASICSYSTPSPESRDRVESVSNDSLMSYSPPHSRRDVKYFSPVPADPCAGSVKKEDGKKSHRKTEQSQKEEETARQTIGEPRE